MHREQTQGLTGLANTIPNAKFSGLRQILHADGMVYDAEYEVRKLCLNFTRRRCVRTTTGGEIRRSRRKGCPVSYVQYLKST